MKICKICEIEKPFSDFTPQLTLKDGYANNCKKCRAAYSKRWRIKNPERVKDNNKRWLTIKKNERKRIEVSIEI